MRRLLVVLLVWAVLPVAPVAAAQPPAAQGWWSGLNLPGLPALPAPPDVAAGDLLVQGGDLVDELPVALRGADRQPSPLAVAALRFAVDPDDTITSLDLSVRGPAVANDVRAFAAAEAWTPAENGRSDLAPDVRLADLSRGLLSGDGKTLSFPDISRLLRPGGVLDIVLVAGIADRVVIAKPTATALSVVAAPPALPPLPEGPVAPPPVDTAPPETAPPFTPLAPLAPPATTPVPSPPVPAPQTARPVIGTAWKADDSRTRALALAEVVLVAVFFGLLGYGPLARLGRWTGYGTTRRGVPVERGLGRFRSVRTGPTPRL